MARAKGTCLYACLLRTNKMGQPRNCWSVALFLLEPGLQSREGGEDGCTPKHILCGNLPSLGNGDNLQGLLCRRQEHLGTSSAAEKQSCGSKWALRAGLLQAPLCFSTGCASQVKQVT